MTEDKESDSKNHDGQPEKTRSGPLVFISHDSRDADLAEAFSKLLSSVSTGMLKTFRSSDKKGVQGFEYGVEWYPELMKMLGTATDVVCLLTSRSIGRPWLLYEAGVAKGKLDIPVHGLALGVPLSKASVGPFAQFQNCDEDAESITKLVEQLVRRLPSADPDHDMVRTQVDSFRKSVAEVLKKQRQSKQDEALPADEASTAKLFEEIKVMFQDLLVRRDADSRVSRQRRRGPRIPLRDRMIPDFTAVASRANSNSLTELGLAALIVAGVHQEEMPWLMPMATEMYRASVQGHEPFFRRASRTFADALEAAMRGPFDLPDVEVSIDYIYYLMDRIVPQSKSAKAGSAKK